MTRRMRRRRGSCVEPAEHLAPVARAVRRAEPRANSSISACCVDDRAREVGGAARRGRRRSRTGTRERRQRRGDWRSAIRRASSSRLAELPRDVVELVPASAASEAVVASLRPREAVPACLGPDARARARPRSASAPPLAPRRGARASRSAAACAALATSVARLNGRETSAASERACASASSSFRLRHVEGRRRVSSAPSALRLPRLGHERVGVKVESIAGAPPSPRFHAASAPGPR